jgi:aryl-alcohol dehydrogenase-like predicted oxidoreductase
MEFRQLGNSGLKVPVLSFGTGTFGGNNEFFNLGAAQTLEKQLVWSISALMLE